MSFSLSVPTRYRIAVSSFFFAQGMIYSSWASRIPDIKNAVNVDVAVWGTVLLSAPIGQITAMALSGYLVTRYGSRFCLRMAVILYSAFLILLGLAPSVPILCASLVLFGMAGNLHNISVNSQAVGVERLHKGSILASFHGIWSLAGFIGGAVSSFMMARGVEPFRQYFLIFLFSGLILLVMGRSLLPRDQKPPPKPQGHGRRFVKPDKYILILGVIAFSAMVCEGTLMNWSGLYFEEIVKPGKDWLGAGYVAFMSTMTCGRFMADKLVNRFGVEKIFRISGGITVSGLMLSVLLPELVPSLIGFMLVGLGVSSVVPLCYSMAGKSKTMHPGVAVATISTIGFLGFLLGPSMIGFIAKVADMRWSFGVVACVGLLMIVMVPWLKKARNAAIS